MMFAIILSFALIALALFVARDLLMSFRDGQTTLRGRTMIRRESPGYFWFYIAAKAFAMSVCLYIAALFLALRFPEYHIIIPPMKQCSPFCGGSE